MVHIAHEQYRRNTGMNAGKRYAKQLNDQADAINQTPKHAHIGVGYCAVCKHYGADCTGTKLRGKAKQQQAEQLLAQLADAQTAMWDLAGELERLLAIEIDTTEDLSGYSIADLKAR